MHFAYRIVNIKWEKKYVKYLVPGLPWKRYLVNTSSCHCYGMHSTKNKVNTIEVVVCWWTPTEQLTAWQVKLPLILWWDLAASPSWTSSQLSLISDVYNPCSLPCSNHTDLLYVGSFWASASTRFLLIPFCWFFTGLLFLLRSHLKCYLLREVFSDYTYLKEVLLCVFYSSIYSLFWRHITIWYELIYLVVSYNTVS